MTMTLFFIVLNLLDPCNIFTMELHTKRLLLDEVVPSDLDNIHLLHSFPEVDRYNTMGIPETIEQSASLLSGWMAHQDQQPRTSYIFCMRSVATKEFVGLMALNLGKPKYKMAEVWYKIFPAHWGHGYTTEALAQVLKFGFEVLQLHRIEAGCAVENVASVRVLEKAGMTREGLQRKALPIRGDWVDCFCYAILETDYDPAAP